MGYESKVAIGCSKKIVKKYKNIFEKYDFYPDEIYANDNDAVFLWNWTKWYDDFDNVKAVMSLTEELVKGPKNHIDYIRIGEEFEDYEKWGASGLIYPFVDIEINWQLGEVKNFDELLSKED